MTAMDLIMMSAQEPVVQWTGRTLPASGLWLCIAYGAGLFVSLNVVDSNSVTSPNGIDWTVRTVPSGEWTNLTFVNNKFVATTTFQALSMTSSDGINWTLGSMPSTQYNWEKIAFGLGLYVCPGFNFITGSSAIASSSDGLHWTLHLLPGISGLRSAAFGFSSGVSQAIFIVPGLNSTEISGDGSFWIQRDPIAPAYNVLATIFVNGIFVSITYSTTTAGIYYSTDGLNWLPVNSNNFRKGESVMYGGGRFVAVGELGSTSSIDGRNWTQSTMPSNMSFRATAYGNGIYVAVGTDLSGNTTNIYATTDFVI